jgi:hypothetical protein
MMLFVYVSNILGDIVRFDIRVVGNPEPVIEWFKNNQPIEDEGRFIIIDEVDDQDKELYSLLIEGCKLEDDAEYSVVAMNEAGKDTSTCHLVVTRKTIPDEFKNELEEVIFYFLSCVSPPVIVCRVEVWYNLSYSG